MRIAKLRTKELASVPGPVRERGSVASRPAHLLYSYAHVRARMILPVAHLRGYRGGVSDRAVERGHLACVLASHIGKPHVLEAQPCCCQGLNQGHRQFGGVVVKS